MANGLVYSTQQQSGQGGSPGRKKNRKKGAAANRLNPLASTLTSNVGNGSGSGVSGVPGASGRPRKMFQKKDLVEAVRRMGTLNASGSRVELGEGSTGSASKDKAGRMKRAHASAEIGGQLRVMETGVVTTSRRYNELKLKADRKAVELQSLLDTLTMIKLEHDALERMKLRQTPESDRIGTLTRGIEDATKEIQGKLHYRRVLHHMMQRLETNKVIVPCALVYLLFFLHLEPIQFIYNNKPFCSVIGWQLRAGTLRRFLIAKLKNPRICSCGSTAHLC